MTVDKINTLLDRLAAFERTELPVVSVYLNAQANEFGRDRFEPFVRKELNERAKTYAEHTPARESFDRDAERIMTFLRDEVDPSSNGIVIFACAGVDDFWETLQLDLPIEQNELFVYNQPHLYPLAKLSDQFPRFAAVLLDAHSAHIFVFSNNKLEDSETLETLKTSRSDQGGWSQARYQRHIDNFYLQHTKEVIDRLEQLVRDEGIEQIVVSASESVLPIFREQVTPTLSDKIIDEVSLDINTPVHQVMQTTLDSIRKHDTETDSEKVDQLFEQYRAGGGGLAVVGVADTLAALNNGQVDQLIITASAREIDPDNKELARTVAAYLPAENTVNSGEQLDILDELVTKARQTDARITFIEDTDLLKDVEGVGALLRWRTQS